jgi:hypothetical protein
MLVVWYWYVQSSVPPENNIVVINKSNVSVVHNNEVSAYYINDVIHTAWIERLEASGFSQLTIENTNTKQQQKVAFNVGLKPKFWYSQGSQRLLVMENNEESFYSIIFNRQQKDPVITKHSTQLPQNSRVLAFDYSGNYLYLAANDSEALDLFSIASGELIGVDELPPAVTDVPLQLQSFSSEANVKLKIWPSPASNGFVLSMHAGVKNRLLYYKNLQATSPTNVIDVNNEVQSAVWNRRGNRFSFSDSSASLFAFQVDEGRLTTFNTNGELINHVVADCGAACFVIASAHGVVKLSEYVFGDAHDYESNHDDAKQHAKIVTTNSIARKESHPQYIQQGLYFVSQQNDSVKIIYRSNAMEETTVYEFDKQAVIDELNVNKSDSYLAGIVNQRPFLLDLNDGEIRYAPITFHNISHIRFADESNDLVFYAETGPAQQSETGRQPSGLYRYSWLSNEVELIEENVKVKTHIELNEAAENGLKRYKVAFTLDNSGNATLSFQNNRPSVELNLLAGSVLNDCMGCWQIHGNYLYQLMASSDRSMPSKMLKTHILSGQQVEVPLLLSDVQNQFNIHPSLQKIALTTRQNLQTKLIKMEGMAQIY